jgi:hypothetical protein
MFLPISFIKPCLLKSQGFFFNLLGKEWKSGRFFLFVMFKDVNNVKSPYFCSVRCKLAVGLLLLYTFCYTPLKEVSRLPFLFMHYYQHLEEQRDLSVWEYLDMHYMHGIIVDEDYFQDMQLPFKSMQDSQVNYLAFCTSVNSPSWGVTIEKYCQKSKWKNSNSEIIQDPTISGVFHPPRPSFMLV